MLELKGGGKLICGVTTLLLNNDALIVKLDQNVNVKWVKLIGGSNGDTCAQMAESADGEWIYFAGFSKNFGSTAEEGALVGKLRSGDGSLEWLRVFRTSETLDPSGIAAMEDGNVLVAGKESGPTVGFNMFLL